VPTGGIAPTRAHSRSADAPVGRDERPAWPKGSLQNPQAGPKVMGDLIDSAIRLSRHEAMILGMDVQPRDALAAAVHNGLTIDYIRELSSCIIRIPLP
jgi:hypothetical protein